MCTFALHFKKQYIHEFDNEYKSTHIERITIV